MDWNDIQMNWNAHMGVAKQRWTRLQDAELEVVSGDRDKLVNKVRDAYHLPHEEAETQVDTWAENLEAS